MCTVLLVYFHPSVIHVGMSVKIPRRSCFATSVSAHNTECSRMHRKHARADQITETIPSKAHVPAPVNVVWPGLALHLPAPVSRQRRACGRPLCTSPARSLCGLGLCPACTIPYQKDVCAEPAPGRQRVEMLCCRDSAPGGHPRWLCICTRFPCPWAEAGAQSREGAKLMSLKGRQGMAGVRQARAAC